MMKLLLSPFFFFLLSLLATTGMVVVVEATYVSCTTNQQCVDVLGLPTAKCDVENTGYCINPFTNGGCLKNMLPGWNRLRVCNSEDPPDHESNEALGICRKSKLDHLEIRIGSQNWESAFLNSWLLQILLSELLDVPTTLESGSPTAKVNFYDPSSSMQYGKSNDWPALELANTLEGADCRLASKDPENYESCAHIVPEVFKSRLNEIRKLIDEEEAFETPLHLGVLGEDGFFIPKFTGIRDQTILTHIGLEGEENRHKLAGMFGRPTSWGDYCDLVSPTNCTSDDVFDIKVATRYPEEDERDRFFQDGDFMGHFRMTEKNDCIKNPKTCTGFILDYPCSWASFTYPTLYHLNISLDTDGMEYSYGQMIQIYHAANATKSNLILTWWTPELLVHQYAGTDAEFLRVQLPRPTQECVDNRVAVETRCSDDPILKYGDPRGACGQEIVSFHKVIASGLYDAIHNDPSVPEAHQSPAHEALHLFSMSELHLGEIFQGWFARNKADFWAYDPRHSTCQWFVDNIELIQNTWVPRGYPRTPKEEPIKSPLQYAATALSLIAGSLVIAATVIAYRKRRTQAIRYAQIEFLYILLGGLLILSAGAFVLTLNPPSDVTCVASTWFQYLGYSFELVPLIVKVSALNHMMKAARRMKRITLDRRHLYGMVFLVTFLMALFLSLWTIIDPPKQNAKYELTDRETEDGDRIVSVTHGCDAGASYWRLIAASWVFLYLIVATVLAVQTRDLKRDFNESSTLAIMIYSHFTFAVMQLVAFALEGTVDFAYLAWARSIILSCDVIATICIYFLPKFVKGTKENTLRARANQFRQLFQGNTDDSSVAQSTVRGSACASIVMPSGFDVNVGGSMLAPFGGTTVCTACGHVNLNARESIVEPSEGPAIKRKVAFKNDRSSLTSPFGVSELSTTSLGDPFGEASSAFDHACADDSNQNGDTNQKDEIDSSAFTLDSEGLVETERRAAEVTTEKRRSTAASDILELAALRAVEESLHDELSAESRASSECSFVEEM